MHNINDNDQELFRLKMLGDLPETKPVWNKTTFGKKRILPWSKDLKKHWKSFLIFFLLFLWKRRKGGKKRKEESLIWNKIFDPVNFIKICYTGKDLFLFSMPVFPICDKITQPPFIPLRSLHCSLKAYLIKHNLQSFDHFHGSCLN